jgi:hypothetical protein
MTSTAFNVSRTAIVWVFAIALTIVLFGFGYVWYVFLIPGALIMHPLAAVIPFTIDDDSFLGASLGLGFVILISITLVVTKRRQRKASRSQ